MNELALFAGVGGGILGGHLLGWRCCGAVELDAFAASILITRQNEGILPPFPVWDDICTFDGKPWYGHIDVVSGGFPCQDISAGNPNAKGIGGVRSGLWKQMARIVGEIRPNYVLVENSPILTSRGLGVVLGDLAGMGYDAEWGVISALEAGLDHQRRRIWILAHAMHLGTSRLVTSQNARKVGSATGIRERREACQTHMRAVAAAPFNGGASWPQPLLRGTKNEFSHWVDRIKTVGNAQVPAVVELAWETLKP